MKIIVLPLELMALAEGISIAVSPAPSGTTSVTPEAVQCNATTWSQIHLVQAGATSEGG
jgi:hypothetical protein